MCLEIDLAQQDIVNLDKRKADPTAITLAKAVAEEIAEADWNRLRYSYLQNKQYWTEQLRSDDSESGAGLRSFGRSAGTGKNLDAARCRHRLTYFRVLGPAMAGCELRRISHPCEAHLDLHDPL